MPNTSLRLSAILPLIALTAALPTVAQAIDTLPSTASAVHPVSPATPPTRDEDTRRGPVVARAIGTDNGDLVASSDVNRITCRAVVGANGGVGGTAGTQWLGTQFGVKAIDPTGKEVRHWTRRDGLPGEYVEAIAASPEGSRIYCLVRVEGLGKLALCAIGGPNGGDHWTVLGTIASQMHPPTNGGWQPDPAIDPWYSRWGRSHLVAFAGGVFAAPSAAEWQSDALLYCWNDARRKLQPVAWDADIRADSDALAINDLWSDGRTRVALATSMGLLTLAIDANGPIGSEAAPNWQRFLPGKSVEALTSAENAGTSLFVAGRDRRVASTESVNTWERPTAPWNLFRVDAATGDVQALPERSAKVEPGNYQNSGQPTVESLVVASDGTVWATTITRTAYLGNSPQKPGGFSQYDPAKHVWNEYLLNGLTTAQMESGNIDYQRQNAPADPTLVPESAVSVLAFSLDIGAPAFRHDGGDRNEYDGSELLNPRRWLDRRFPLWACPEDTRPSDPNGRDNQNAFADPAGVRWNANGQELTATAPSPGAGTVAPPPQRFTLHGGTVSEPPRVVMTAPPLPGNDSLVLQTESGIYLLTENTLSGNRTWKSLSANLPNPGDYNNYGTQITRSGPDHRLTLLRRDNDGYHIHYFDPGSGTFVKTADKIPDNLHLIGSSSTGAWLHDYNTLSFLPSNGTLEKVDPTLPASLAPPGGQPYRPVIGVTGNIAWYQTQVRQPSHDSNSNPDVINAVIGYDRAAQRWTAPLELTTNNNFQARPLEGADGAPYVAYDQPGNSVFRYDAAHDLWKSIAPPIPPLRHVNDWQRGITLVSADEREIYVTDQKRLLCFDRRTNLWTPVALPTGLQTDQGQDQNDIRTRAQTTRTAVWLGNDHGLWRFDRAHQTFVEITHPVSLEPNPTQEKDRQAVASLDVLAADTHSVWGQARPIGEFPVLFRFDKAASRFTVYDRTSGLTGIDNGFDIKSDGDTIWLFRGPNTFRLNPHTQRFEERIGEHGRDDNSPLPPGLLHGEVATIAPDPLDPDLVYVSLTNTDSPDPGGTQPPILYRYHKTTNHLDPIPTTGIPASATPHATRGLLATATHIWIATTLGIYTIDRHTGIWAAAPLPAGTPPLTAITDIYEAADKSIWLSGNRVSVRVGMAGFKR